MKMIEQKKDIPIPEMVKIPGGVFHMGRNFKITKGTLKDLSGKIDIKKLKTLLEKEFLKEEELKKELAGLKFDENEYVVVSFDEYVPDNLDKARSKFIPKSSGKKRKREYNNY